MQLINSYQLTPNYYVMLWLMYYDKPHKIGPSTQQALEKLEFIKDGKLTNKAINLFKKEDKKLNDQQLREFLEELRDLFPKGVKINGSPVRTTIGLATVRKMKKLIEEYDFSKDLIVKATKAYVDNKKRDNYKYMMKFTNFIDKQNVGSELASYCQMIRDGEEIQQNRIERTL